MDMPRDDQHKLTDDGLAAYYITRARCAKLQAEVEKLTTERDHLKQVESVLMIELGAVITTAGALLDALARYQLDGTPKPEPADVDAAWDNLEEVIESARKCLL